MSDTAIFMSPTIRKVSLRCLKRSPRKPSELTVLHAGAAGERQNVPAPVNDTRTMAWQHRDHVSRQRRDPDPTHGLQPGSGVCVLTGAVAELGLKASAP